MLFKIWRRPPPHSVAFVAWPGIVPCLGSLALALQDGRADALQEVRHKERLHSIWARVPPLLETMDGHCIYVVHLGLYHVSFLMFIYGVTDVQPPDIPCADLFDLR